MIEPDLGDDGALASDDLGVVVGVDAHGQGERPQLAVGLLSVQLLDAHHHALLGIVQLSRGRRIRSEHDVT